MPIIDDANYIMDLSWVKFYFVPDRFVRRHERRPPQPVTVTRRRLASPSLL